MATEKINEEINYPEVRLLLEDGTQHGIVSSRTALIMANEKGLDLLEISSTANPPVCKLVDYGKYKFERTKKDKEVRKKSRENQVELKELKFRPKIEEHDYNVKIKHIRRFIMEGNKVKLTVRYRGREIVFQNHGLALLNRIVQEVEDIAVVYKIPEIQGKQHIMIISPKNG
ncbi:MAG: translation initiation factor IF-3 [Deferribacteraceae bacterium]|jgi:translation initiation factor IF-3|nr:translation initiation factor IF-3 [Deferribacteraceae bacterium]